MEHRYDLVVRWDGNLGEGTSTYTSFGREHTVRADGPPELLGSSDPGFRGDPTRWNPEQLFVASLSQCHMLWYLHVCAEAGVVVMEYVDEAVGTMTTERDGGGRFTDVLLRPRVVVASVDQVDAAVALHERAHAMCFIARSVSCPVRHQPQVSAG